MKKTKSTPFTEEQYDADLYMALDTFYDNIVLRNLKSLIYPEIVGYEEKKVPRYLHIWLPVINRYYDSYMSYEFGEKEFLGLLLSLKRFRICRIGSRLVKEPIFKSVYTTGKTIKFKRYSPLKIEKKKIS